MEIKIRGEKMKITDAMHEYVEEKLGKLDKNLENNYVIINGTKYNFTTGGNITSEDGSIEISFENILTKKVPIIINEENISLSKTTYPAVDYHRRLWR